MKHFFVLFIMFVLTFGFIQAQPNFIKFYFQDGSVRQYNLGDIENIEISKKQSNNVMKVFYQDSMNALYPVISIDSFNLHNDKNGFPILNIYISGMPRSFLVSEIDSIFFYELLPKLAEGVIIIDSLSSKDILMVDSSHIEIILQSQLGQSLKVANVLVSGISEVSPYGFLRRIKSISIENGKIVAETENAKLTDALTDGMFVFHKTFTPDDTIKTGLNSAKKDKTQGNVKFDFNFEDLEIAPFISFDINSSYSFDFFINGVVEDGEVKQFLAQIGVEKTQEIIAHSELEKEFEISTTFSDLTGITLIPLPPIPIPITGIPLPIIITPNIDLFFGISLKLEAGVSAGARTVSTSVCGFDYNSGVWTLISENYEEGSLIPPELSVGGTLKAFIGPQLNVNFYGFQDALNFYINILGFVELDVDLLNKPLWSLYRGVEGNGGIESDWFEFDKQFPLIIDYKELIARSNNLISGINPKKAKMGDTITISGDGFGDVRSSSLVGLKYGNSLVTNNGVIFASQYIDWNDNTIKVVVPYGLTVGNVKVFLRKDGLYSEMVNFGAEEAEFVQIGSQKWMPRNLDVMTYRNGDTIPEVKDAAEWGSLTTDAWCYYNNDPENGKVYGKLYNWYAVNDPRGLAPLGWHIPTLAEWQALIDVVGADVGGAKIKEIGKVHWREDSVNVTNETGFTALPAGYRWLNNFLNIEFSEITTSACWWSSTAEDNLKSYCIWVYAHETNIYKDPWPKTDGYSIRCIKD